MSDEPTSRRSSTLVAAGILLSRIAGFVRLRAFGHFFGTTDLADAFTAAFRIPNLMQNLLGEGVLSASFIPVHSRLLAAGKEEEAGRVAGAVAGLLAATAGAITLVAVVAAGPLTSVLVPGFTGPKRDITVDLIRIVTPGVGLLVLSAWCLGVLNSHRRFFLSYVAPVLWNLVQIVVLVGAGIVLLDDPLRPATAPPDTLETLVRAFGVGSLLGGAAQFLIQLPAVLRLEPHLKLSLQRDLPPVREILGAFGPIVAGRGVVQLSAYLDLLLASLLATGATAALGYAQQLYLLPVSLFGMSVAAAELPELSTADRADTRAFARRLDDGLARIAFYVVISIVVFVVAGDLVVGALFRTGAFGRQSEILVWLLLITFSGALVTTTSSRLLQSALYGIGDARTPARVAVQRVVLAAVVGVAVMFQLDRLGIVDGAIRLIGDLPAFGPVPAELRESSTGQIRLGALGLTLGAVAGSWLEFRLLRRALHRHLGVWVVAGGRHRGHLAVPAVAAIVVGFLARALVGDWPRILGGGVAAVAMVGVYVAVATRTRVSEADALVGALARRGGPLGRMVTLRREQRRRRR